MKIFKKTELNALSVYDKRYIKTKVRTYGDKFYTNFWGLIVPEDNIECESFTDSLLLHESKYYLQVYLDMHDYKIAYKQTKTFCIWRS